MIKILSLFLVFFLTGCLPNNSSSSNDQASSQLESSQEELSDSTISYTGTVGEGNESNDKRLLILNLQPETSSDAASFDEVVLLMEGVTLIESDSGDALELSEINEGDLVKVVLKENAPTTMSLPPQIPGNAIISVERTLSE